MFSSQILPLNSKNNIIRHCQTCVLSKFVKLYFVSSTAKVDPLWGPSPILSKLSYTSFVLFIDHFTCYTWVYFLLVKSELATVAKTFILMIETQF